MPSYRILIIDDSRDLSRLLKSALLTLDASFEVVEVPSGEEALLEINRKLPDLFVVDIRLPGISGFEFLEKIQSRYGNIKFIIVSGSTDPEIITQAKKLARDNFFKKPLHIGEFLTAVERCLGLAPSIQSDDVEAVISDTVAVTVNIKDLLPVIQKKLGAVGVFWLDEAGKIIEQTGEGVTAEFLSLLTPSILTMRQAMEGFSANLELSASLGITAIKGKDHDLLLSYHGADGLIMIVLRQLESSNLSVAFDLLKKAYPDQRKDFQGTNQIDDLSSDDELPEDFDKFLAAIENQRVDFTQSTAYWDETSMTGHEGLHASNPDIITYDQANEMGLAPDEE